LKFLVDMPVTPLAVTHLRAIGHDAVHAHEIGLARASDIQVLQAARREERIIVTADLDYPRLLAVHQASPGIILFRGACTRMVRCSGCSIEC
jgi:predicted nuclease of predicted toxin-antitoxin system